MSISVIMPALNEEKNIEAAVRGSLQAFREYAVEGEVIVINDGSTDSTAAIVGNIMKTEPLVKMITHVRPCGIGACFWDGVDCAVKDIVVMLPGDNENDSGQILRYAGLLNEVDVVIPFVFNKDVRSFARNAASGLFTFIINATFFTSFNYTNGTVMYRRAVLGQLADRGKGFFYQTDIIIRLARMGYLYAQVPYRLDRRSQGKSKALRFSNFLKMGKDYLKLITDIHFCFRARGNGIIPESASAKRYKED